MHGTRVDELGQLKGWIFLQWHPADRTIFRFIIFDARAARTEETRGRWRVVLLRRVLDDIQRDRRRCCLATRSLRFRFIAIR